MVEDVWGRKQKHRMFVCMDTVLQAHGPRMHYAPLPQLALAALITKGS